MSDLETHVTEVLADTERPVARRAQFTRDHLQDNGLTVQDVGLDVANPQDDAALVRAVIALQMRLFPNDRKEWDGMYGKYTFEAYQKSLERDNQDKLADLREKVEAARRAHYQAEGIKVQHDRIAPEITSTYHITPEVIQAAEQECAESGKLEALPARENFVRLVDYVARVTDVPPNAIVALVNVETGGSFNPLQYGTAGELGMGQFMEKYWGSYAGNRLFKEEMAKFTSQNPQTIGRARSMVADLLAVGIKLKESERVAGPFHYGDRLTNDQLLAMRFHYHAPSYAAQFYGKAKGNAEYAQKAQAAYGRNQERYYTRFVNQAVQIYEPLIAAIARLQA